jgi:hypothetical protein
MGIAVVYAAYLSVSIALTVIVASALSRSGRVYLAGAFGGDEGMATAVSRMLVVGFCLLSLGYAALTLRTSGDIRGPGEAIGVLSVKVGEELLVLGALHLVNMMFFTRLRRRQEAGGRPGGPALARRGADWPRTAPAAGRPGAAGWPGATATGQPGTATVTGQPGADWPRTAGGPDVPGPDVPAPGRLAAAAWPVAATGR